MSKSYEKHIRGNDVFLCSMTAEERKEYFSDQRQQERQQRVPQEQTLSTNKVPYRVRSPYAKCEVCGNPYLKWGKPCDHIDRRPGVRLMPDWCDNPAEWRMLCDRYDYISSVGRLGSIRNSDDTYRFERIE
jgi:hypothetical protein